LSLIVVKRDNITSLSISSINYSSNY
jgi:hypothetical protein